MNRFEMDQMNILPNNAQRLDSSRDLLQNDPTHWMARPHDSPMSPWPSQTLPLGPLYMPQQHGLQRPLAGGQDPTQLMPSGQYGTLPHPGRNARDAQTPPSFAGLPAAAMHWGSTMQSAPLDVGSAASTISVTNTWGNMNADSSDLTLRPPAAMGWASPSATLGTLTVPPSQDTSSEGLPNTFSRAVGASTTPSYFPLSPISPRRLGQASSPTAHLSQRPPTSPASLGYRDNSGLLSPASDRRRQSQTRTRRVVQARQSVPDYVHLEDGVSRQQVLNVSPASRSSLRGSHQISPSQEEDAMVRQMQMYRGALQSKLVASKAALQSLESVEASALPDSEKTCVICYNDYGVASPEGINEAPLRLPQCKHIFGDHCIKKWLEDSDSCPYCRSKLQSEPKHLFGSARTFMQMMRLRGLPLPAGVSEDMISRVVSRPVGESELQELFMRSARTAERRSPPDDASGHNYRRTRQRRGESGLTSGSHVAEFPMAQRYISSEALSLDGSLQPQGGLSTPGENPWVTSTPGAFVAPDTLRSQIQPRGSWTGVGYNPTPSVMRRGVATEPVVSRATRPQRIDSSATVIANGSSIPPPTILNPLQRPMNQRRVGISLPHETAASTTPLAAAHSTTALVANSPSVEAELGPLRPTRNRPW